MSAVTTHTWSSFVPSVTRTDWQEEIRQLTVRAEARRFLADYDTGSILPEEAYQLRALAESLKTEVVIEVGTFVGLSTTALASASRVTAVYTCDASNDCLQATLLIRTHAKQSSTEMLVALLLQQVKADLFFFDGTLTQADAPYVRRLSHGRTVYAFHDYNHGPKQRLKHGRLSWDIVPRKGIGNVRLLHPSLPSHELVEPLDGTTLALLVPK